MVVSVATPLAFTAPVPMVAVPLRNVTVPFVTGNVPDFTVAVNVMLCSRSDGAGRTDQYVTVSVPLVVVTV